MNSPINWTTLLGGSDVRTMKNFVIGDSDFTDLIDVCKTTNAKSEVYRLRRRGLERARSAARKALTRRGLYASSR